MKRNAYRFLVGNFKNRAWENGIKMALKEMGRECVDWMRLAHSRGFQWQAVMNKDVKLRAQ
jgi:hypothetical protein